MKKYLFICLFLVIVFIFINHTNYDDFTERPVYFDFINEHQLENNELKWLERHRGVKGVYLFFNSDDDNILLNYNLNKENFEYISIEVNVKMDNSDLLIYINEVDAIDDSDVKNYYVGHIKNSKVKDVERTKIYVNKKRVNFRFEGR